MNTAVINIKVDPTLKTNLQMVANELGLSVSGLTNAFYKNLVRTRAVSFSAREEPSDWLIEQFKAAEKDIKAGRVSPAFTNARDAIAWLDNPKKKYASKVR